MPDVLVVDPAAGQITLNGTPVVSPGVEMSRYRVSFLGAS
jgi:hypothetical protein